MASIAQEESRSISANVTMGKRWGMQEGKVTIPFKNFLGYKKGTDGKFEIDEEQAKVVRFIYREFLFKGRTYTSIANTLNEANVPTPSGIEGGKWTSTSIVSILTNEKYKGDALLQKKYVDNYLEHSIKKNEGKLPQYYVENNHPAIIDKEEWEMVQTEIERRKSIGKNYSSTDIFASKLTCEDCGGFFGKKIWHSNTTYAKSIYRCNRKFDKTKKKCETPHLTEDEIKSMFIKAYNRVMTNKEQLLQDTKEVVEILTDTTELDKKIVILKNDIDLISETVRKLVADNSKTIQSQEEYKIRYDELTKRYDSAKAELDKVLSEKAYRLGQSTKLQSFIKELEKADEVLDAWNDELWMLMIKKAIVHKDKSITFKFYNGNEIRIEAE